MHSENAPNAALRFFEQHVWQTCSCGFRGCWESLAAGPAMVAWFKSNTATASRYGEDFTAKRICQLAQEKDELALRAVEREAYYLGVGLANLVNLFTPDSIVLGGSVMKSAVGKEILKASNMARPTNIQRDGLNVAASEAAKVCLPGNLMGGEPNQISDAATLPPSGGRDLTPMSAPDSTT